MEPIFRLPAAEYDKILFILSSLQDKLSSDSVFLIHRNGQQIAHHGESGVLDIEGLSSLAASNLAATFGLAQMIGEQEFERIYHRGENSSLLMKPVGRHAFLLLIQSNGGDQLDGHSLRQAVLILEDLLKKAETRDRQLQG